MSVTRAEILSLYKSLLSYSRKLTLTDPVYFRRRITTEFKNNKTLSNEKQIQFAFKKGEELVRRGAVV